MKKKILLVASLLFGLMFINAGLNKFFNYMPVPEDMPEQAINMFNAMMQIGSKPLFLLLLSEIKSPPNLGSRKYLRPEFSGDRALR